MFQVGTESLLILPNEILQVVVGFVQDASTVARLDFYVSCVMLAAISSLRNQVLKKINTGVDKRVHLSATKGRYSVAT